MIRYYRHAEVGSLTGTLRAWGGGGHDTKSYQLIMKQIKLNTVKGSRMRLLF